MGRSIDLSKPLSEEDRAFLASRARTAEIVTNDRQFAHLSEEDREEAISTHDEEDAKEKADQAAWEQALQDADENSFPEHLVEKVAPLSVNQLKTALKKRGQPTTGDKEELQLRLVTFLEQAEKDKG
jgi:hypothetical protein